MEVAPRVDKLLARAVDEQVSEQRLIREALQDVGARLAHVEAATSALVEKIEGWSDPGAATADMAVRVEKRLVKRFEDIEDRIDELAETVEARAVETMTEDLTAVADELRQAVGDLARLLVRDRKRIGKVLTEHRNAILAELRMPAPTTLVDVRDNGGQYADGDDADGDDDGYQLAANGDARRRLWRLR
jgi:DNA repair ATPase RecN